MNIMITGCAGFIGSHVTEEFINNGYNVYGVDSFTYAGKKENLNNVIDNDNFKLTQCNILSTELLKILIKKNNIKWVVHLAAETHVDNSIRDSEIFLQTNIKGTKSILDACLETKIKLLHFSTDEVYGCALDKSFTENEKLDPRNPYSASKASAEHLVTSYNNTYDLEYVMVRPSNNFGPRQHSEKFLPTILRKINSGDKIPLYGDGLHEREWMYVKETAKATRFILENSKMNEVYNVSSGFHMKNLHVIQKVCNILNIDSNNFIEYVKDRPGHDRKYSIDSTKLNELGHQVLSDFDSHLEETIHHTYNGGLTCHHLTNTR